MVWDSTYDLDNHPDGFYVNARCPVCWDEMEYSPVWHAFHCPNCGTDLAESDWDGGFDEEAEWY